MGIVRNAGWLVLALVGWIVYAVPMLLLMLIGLLIVASLAWQEDYATRLSTKYPTRSVLAWGPRWAWLWGNEQNGIDGASGDDLPSGWPHATWPKFLQILDWSAVRNSVGNARWVPFFGMAVDPAAVRVCWASATPVPLASGYFLVRQGWQFQLRFTWWGGMRQCRVGWGIAEETGKTPLGVGFAFKPWATV
jgi:hypothetical protein